MTKVRVTASVLGWFEGSQAWFDPKEGDTFLLFKELRETRSRKDGSVTVDLNASELELLNEWASYMENAAFDDASAGEMSAMGELNAARALQRQIARLKLAEAR